MNVHQAWKRLSLLMGVLLVTLSVFTGRPVSAQERRTGTTVFTIPVGDEGVHYGSKRSGPAGLAVVPDGTVVVADTVGNRLLRYDSRGRRIGVIDLKDLVVGATDVEASLHGVFVLDSSAQPQTVHLPITF